MAYVVVRNSAARADGDAAIAAVMDELGADARLAETGSVDDLDAVVASHDEPAVVVCGGDGSVHLAVASLRRHGRLADTVVGIVPLGTGNDLAGSLGIPDDPAAAAAVVAAARTRRLDLVVGDDDTICVNALHAGAGVEASEEAADLKAGLGALAYPLGAVIAGATTSGLDLEVIVDGEPLRPADGGPALMVAIANAATIGGGTTIAPGAEPDDGRLDVVLSCAVSPTARAGFGAALAAGTHLDRPDVTHRRGRHVLVTGDEIVYNVDGEVGGVPVRARSWHLEPDAWRVAVPESSA